MQKKWSLYLGKVTGIKVFIHWTFWILIAWIFIMHYQQGHGFQEAMRGVIFIFALFACVVLHELGHSLTARRFKIPTRDITIYPIGGVASLEHMPEKPQQELLVAIAGPLVNVVIALILWVYLQNSGQLPDLSQMKNAEHMSGLNFGFNLLAVNVVLAVFNLLPAFPMDGGRVLRALLAFRLDRGRATQIAATIGQFLAIGFVFFGFFYNFWLVFIGLFIFLGAGAESKFEMIRSSLANISFGDVMMTKYSTLHPDDTIQTALLSFNVSGDKAFLIAEDEKVVGVAGEKEIMSGMREFGNSVELRKIMQDRVISFLTGDQLDHEFMKMQEFPQPLYPVYDDDRLAGVISMERIQQWLNLHQRH